MKRASLGISALGIAALALTPLAVTGTAQAAGADPDKTFGPAERSAAMVQARVDRSDVAKALRLGAKESLQVRDVVRDANGVEHVRYDRTYAGLPVIGGDLIVHETRQGDIKSVTWASDRAIEVSSTKPLVSAERAADAAARRANLKDGTSAPRTVVYAVDQRPVLAWESTVTGTAKDGSPIEDLVYTDARTGKELARHPQVHHADGTGNSQYSGTVGLKATLSGSTYQLTDGTRGGHKTNDANNSTSQTAPGTLFTDTDNVWGNGATSSRQTAAVDAAYGAAVTWDYFKDAYGRLGIRNDGVAAYSRVHYGTNYENAFWYDPCFCMTYGDGGASLSALTSLDVAGHEMSHGVTSATAGLVYSGDAGGLNEATSDVFGTMVEFKAANSADPGDYYVGEKIMKDGTYLRRMDNPSADGSSVNCWTSTTKNLDPHYSSGVGNHYFYLLAEGTGTKTIGGRTHTGTACNGATLTGIGKDAAAAIWYRALTTYMTSTTTYPQARDHMVKSAKDLYGASSSQCTATAAAWTAVSVSGTETCGATPPPAGGNLLANPGFESGAVSWTATSGVITNSASATPRTGSYYAWLDGYGAAHTDTLSQTVTIPAGGTSATLSFYLKVTSSETTTTSAYDTLKVQVVDGGTTTTLATYSNLNKGTSYVAKSLNLNSYLGKTVTIKFLGVEDSSLATSFFVDDTSLTTG